MAKVSLVKLPSDFPLDLTNDKSTLGQVMAWCCQATYGITRPQWVKYYHILLSHRYHDCWKLYAARKKGFGHHGIHLVCMEYAITLARIDNGLPSQFLLQVLMLSDVQRMSSLFREYAVAAVCNLAWGITRTCSIIIGHKLSSKLRTYRQVSNIRRTNSQHLRDSHSVLRLSMPNPLKPDGKSRMKM